MVFSMIYLFYIQVLRILDTEILDSVFLFIANSGVIFDLASKSCKNSRSYVFSK